LDGGDGELHVHLYHGGAGGAGRGELHVHLYHGGVTFYFQASRGKKKQYTYWLDDLKSLLCMD